MLENESITVALDDDTMLPDGWGAGDDIFDPTTWSGSAEAADESVSVATEDTEADHAAEGTDTAPTTEPTEDPGDGTPGSVDAPTTEQPTETKEKQKLRFTARVDRADLDVEVDESELPTLYQKAQATDRAQAKLAKLTPQLEKAQRLAKAMGFDTLDDMLDSAENTYRDNEVSRLVGEGVHEEVAKDMVSRRINSRATEEPSAAAVTPTPEVEPPSRDFAAEVSELLAARPDLVGTTIPSEVLSQCVEGNKRLIVAYSAYEAKQAKAENERLAKKVKVMEQNASAAARNPVAGVSSGGPTDTKAKSDFERGFDSVFG